MEKSTKSAVRRILSQNITNSHVYPELSPAGVMVLMYVVDGCYKVLLNVRSETVPEHKGEISFPGGRWDEGDATLLDTALRENHEEMGIWPADVEVLGELEDQPTISNYVIRPFVGTITAPYLFKPNSREVAEVIEVPINNLLQSEGVRDEIRLVDGSLVNSPMYAYEGHLIFGATAKILRRFLEILDNLPHKDAEWKRKCP